MDSYRLQRTRVTTFEINLQKKSKVRTLRRRVSMKSNREPVKNKQSPGNKVKADCGLKRTAASTARRPGYYNPTRVPLFLAVWSGYLEHTIGFLLNTG